MKTKVYVSKDLNKVPSYMQKHINKGDKVIVVDGSYMEKASGELVYGVDFIKEGLHELLTVLDTNTSYPTDVERGGALSYYNNCSIIGNDGTVYYCSKVNIVRFSV